MTCFWTDYVGVDEDCSSGGGGTAPAPVFNWQAWNLISPAYFVPVSHPPPVGTRYPVVADGDPNDLLSVITEGLSVTLNAGSPTYSFSIPFTSTVRTYPSGVSPITVTGQTPKIFIGLDFNGPYLPTGNPYAQYEYDATLTLQNAEGTVIATQTLTNQTFELGNGGTQSYNGTSFFPDTGDGLAPSFCPAFTGVGTLTMTFTLIPGHTLTEMTVTGALVQIASNGGEYP